VSVFEFEGWALLNRMTSYVKGKTAENDKVVEEKDLLSYTPGV
jgi:hypothetical protein